MKVHPALWRLSRARLTADDLDLWRTVHRVPGGGGDEAGVCFLD